MMKDTDLLALSLLFASTYDSGGTRWAKKDEYAVLKTTAAVPVSAATTYSCPSVTVPSA